MLHIDILEQIRCLDIIDSIHTDLCALCILGSTHAVVCVWVISLMRCISGPHLIKKFLKMFYLKRLTRNVITCAIPAVHVKHNVV